MSEEVKKEEVADVKSDVAADVKPEVKTDVKPDDARVEEPKKEAPETGANADGVKPQPETETLENLLAGDDDGAAEKDFENSDGAVSFKPAEMTPEELDAFVAGMKLPELNVGKDAYGNDVKLGDAEVRVLAPFLSGIGLSAKQSSAVVHGLAALEGARLKAEVKAQRDLVSGLVSASREKFGADIGRFVSEAKRGGKALFGEAWEELKCIPAFCNDPRIIEALAGYGRSVATDDGASGKDAGGMNSKDFAEAWIASSNRKAEANG